MAVAVDGGFRHLGKAMFFKEQKAALLVVNVGSGDAAARLSTTFGQFGEVTRVDIEEPTAPRRPRTARVFLF